MAATDSLLCEVCSPDDPTASALAEIATACARELGLSLAIKTAAVRAKAGPHSTPSVLTLHLPVEQAASQHEVWCLACRLACFCPSARVSVLVLGQSHFQPTDAPRQSRSA